MAQSKVVVIAPPIQEAQSSSDSTTELAHRWRMGDDSAFERLVDRYSGPLLSFAISRLRHLQDGEDAVQETFLRAYRSAHQLRDENRLWLWLKQIANNVLMDALKRGRRSSAIAVDPEEMEKIEARDKAGPHFTLQEIAEIIEGLPETYRETAIYFYLQEWPYSKIAETLGIEPATVRQRISRANRLLRESLGRKHK